MLYGQRCCALLDSGARVSCIAYSLFEKLGVSMNTQVQITLNGIGSCASRASGVVSLAIGLPSAFHGPYMHDFVVVDERMMPFCLILGADYMVAHDISLNFVSGRCMQGEHCLAISFVPPERILLTGMVVSVPSVAPVGLVSCIKQVCV
jgi:hypothetical protein